MCALLSGPIESHKFMACDPIRYGSRKEVQAFKETSDWGRWIERNRNLVYFGLVCVDTGQSASTATPLCQCLEVSEFQASPLQRPSRLATLRNTPYSSSPVTYSLHVRAAAEHTHLPGHSRPGERTGNTAGCCCCNNACAPAKSFKRQGCSCTAAPAPAFSCSKQATFS